MIAEPSFWEARWEIGMKAEPLDKVHLWCNSREAPESVRAERTDRTDGRCRSVARQTAVGNGTPACG